MEMEEFFVRTGEFGLFQKRAFAGCLLIGFFSGTVMVQNIFAGAVPTEKVCSNQPKIDACHPSCPSISYPEDKFISFATEWNMTCGASVTLVHTTQSIYMAGIVIGSFFMGGLADSYGRLPVLLTCQVMCSLAGVISSFASTWRVYAFFRFLAGLFISGISIAFHVLTTELVGPSKRGLISTMPSITFSLGLASLSLLAWISLNWRLMSAVVGLFGLALVSPAIYFVYEESPRWHLAKGNMENYQRILQKIARTNGHDLGHIELKANTSKGGRGSHQTMLSLFRNRTLCKVTVIQLFSWFTVSNIYYGLTLASGDTGANRYVSVLVNAIIEIPAYMLIAVVMNQPRYGRVKSSVVGMLMSSVFCGSIWLVDQEASSAIATLAYCSKFFIAMSFATVYVQAGELFPTPIRNMGLGLVSESNRIGGMFAPQIVNLNNISANSHFAVFGALGIASGIVCTFLPETLGRPLPDTPEDIYKHVETVQPVKLGDKKRLIDDSERT